MMTNDLLPWPVPPACQLDAIPSTAAPSYRLAYPTGLLLIDLALRKANHRAAIRLLTLPHSHPLHNIVQQVKEHPPRKHESPIAGLLRIFDLLETTVETILPIAQLPRVNTNYTTSIPGTREESIEYEKNNKADFKVFTDGLGLNEGIGAAAILYAKNRHSPSVNLRCTWGRVQNTIHTRRKP
jgi:hypothetical protein